jgi:MFS family permease
MEKEGKDRLITGSYLAACMGNFLLFFGFYILLPVLPLYLIESFEASKSQVGLVLSGYTVAALLVRPFTAYFADMFRRKPLYLCAYICFVLLFVSYPLVASIMLFLLMRVLHGLAFGAVTTLSNTLIVDIMPASRRGEGLGYFGMANNLAMAVGPMIGLFIHDISTNFLPIFQIAIASGVTGFIFASLIKVPHKEPLAKESLSFDRFFLPRGLLAGFCLFLLGMPYGITTTYIALFGRELGLNSGMGIFFSLMAAGLIISRLFAGRLVDRGKLTQVIFVGSLICAATFLILALLRMLPVGLDLLALLLYSVALLLGVGYGMMFPAYNTLFVNLAPHNRRATASSTYLTSWDVGIGIGLVGGGYMAEYAGMTATYSVAAGAALLSALVFKQWTAAHFHKHKFR